MNKITLVFEMSYKQLSRGVALCVLTCCLAWSTAAAAQEVAVTGTVLLAKVNGLNCCDYPDPRCPESISRNILL